MVKPMKKLLSSFIIVTAFTDYKIMKYFLGIRSESIPIRMALDAFSKQDSFLDNKK